jgi:hypothetical protein
VYHPPASAWIRAFRGGQGQRGGAHPILRGVVRDIQCFCLFLKIQIIRGRCLSFSGEGDKGDKARLRADSDEGDGLDTLVILEGESNAKSQLLRALILDRHRSFRRVCLIRQKVCA